MIFLAKLQIYFPFAPVDKAFTSTHLKIANADERRKVSHPRMKSSFRNRLNRWVFVTAKAIRI